MAYTAILFQLKMACPLTTKWHIVERKKMEIMASLNSLYFSFSPELFRMVTRANLANK